MCGAHPGAGREQSRDRLTLAGELRQAIGRGELILHYQPKIHCTRGRVTGLEALVRWQHPRHGLLGPDLFIPLAEQSDQTADSLGGCGSDRATPGMAYERHRPAGLGKRVDARPADPQLPETIARLLGPGDVTSTLLELEITESALMADPARALAVIRQLRALGLGIAIDDFGTGYSSLTYLKHLPFDCSKIDKSFVRQLATDRADLAIVRSVVESGHNLGLTVVAEGVEDRASWDQLAQLGCDVAQGYYLARPAPPMEFEHWLQTSTWGRGVPGLAA